MKNLLKNKGHKLYSCSITVNYEGCIVLTKSNTDVPAHKTFTNFNICFEPKKVILIDDPDGIIGKNKKGQITIRKSILDLCDFTTSIKLEIFEHQIHLTSS